MSHAAAARGAYPRCKSHSNRALLGGADRRHVGPDVGAVPRLYLGGILNPTTNLRHFPIAVVNEDAGPTGKQIVDGLVAGLDKNKFDIRVVSHDEARHCWTPPRCTARP